MPTIPSLSHDAVRKELEGIVCDFGDYEPGEIGDEVVDRWHAAYSANDQRDLLIDAENPDVFTLLHSRGRTVNRSVLYYYLPDRVWMTACFPKGSTTD